MLVTKNATDEYFMPLTDETVTRTRGIVKGGVISARIFHAFSTRAGVKLHLSCTVATILYSIVGMDHINLAWLDLLPCKTLLPYMEKHVSTQVWNYML